MASFQPPYFEWQGPTQSPPIQPPPFQPGFASLPPFPPNTSMYQAPDTASYQANMSLNMGMVHRIAVLETELRIEKESKAAAQQVNQYLLQQLGQNASSPRSISDHKTNERLKRAAHKISLLKEKLRKHRRIRSYSRELAEYRGQVDVWKRETPDRHQQPAPAKPQPFAPIQTPSAKTSLSNDSHLSWDFTSDSDDVPRVDLGPTVATSRPQQSRGHALGLGVAPPLWKGRGANTSAQPAVPSLLPGQLQEDSRSCTVERESSNLIDLHDMHDGSEVIPTLSTSTESPAKEEIKSLQQSTWAPTQQPFSTRGPGLRASARGFTPAPGSPADMLRTQAMLMFRPSLGFINVYRTIIVTNIPNDASLSDVLAPVCGGQVISARYMNTMPVCGSNSAMITFRLEASARRFFEYAKQCGQHSAAKHITEENRPSSCAGDGMNYSLLDSPTFPMTREEHDLIRQEGTTRLISIHGLDASITSDSVQRMLLAREPFADDHTVIRSVRDDGGVFYLECSSICAANQVAQRIRRNMQFQYSMARFEPDPCERPVPPTASEVLETVEVASPDSERPSPSGLAAAETGTSTAAVDEVDVSSAKNSSSTTPSLLD